MDIFFVEQKAEVVRYQVNKPEDLLRHVERCARICYGSEEKQTDDSYINFCGSLAKSGHTSVFAHAKVTFVLEIDDFCEFYRSFCNNHTALRYFDSEINDERVTMRTTLRGLMEYCWHYEDAITLIGDKLWPVACTACQDPIKKPGLSGIAKVTCLFAQDDFYTLRLQTDRRTSHQLVRHGTFGITQASQRYRGVNTFIHYGGTIDEHAKVSLGKYNLLLEYGFKKQEARSLLPATAETSLFMSGTSSQWKGFLLLRDSKHADTMMQELAKLIKTAIRGDGNYKGDSHAK